MEAAVNANVLPDHIEFHIFPSQNRYEACVCSSNKIEKVTSGLLEHLLLHSAEIKALHSKGSSAKYILSRPKNSHDIKWFTKSTLIRFLRIIGSANILDVTNSLRNEICQLEEARKFHFSLYAKGREYQLQSGESDGIYLENTGSTPRVEGSDASKNELLRAMDLRLATLVGELIAAFDQAADSRYSVEEMTDIEKFSRHFGSGDLSDSIRKHIELRQGSQVVENSSSKHLSEGDRVRSKEGNNHATKSSSSEIPVKYGVSPAKAAQVERQNSTESDESSFSSEEDQPSAERSRTLIRSASPRRSASPMRRVQIGRSGSRRSTAITIKSLNYFPGREKSFLPRDTEIDSGEEGPEQAPRRPESNSRRMSVQDAINLFERKQKDQTVDIQKERSLLNASMNASKAVLRRWSSGMGEESSLPQDSYSEGAVAKMENNDESRETAFSSPEPDHELGVSLQDSSAMELCGLNAKLDRPENGAVVMQEEALPTESTEVSEKLTASAEWSRQKEAELNELLTKMMETKPVKRQTVVPANTKRQSLPPEKRGASNDHYKDKRDEKLREEAARKRTEKDKQFKAMQQILDTKKSKVTSANAGDAGKKQNVKKLQKPQKTVSQPANPKTESPRPSIVKKTLPKESSLPATRKSWPSMPSPRTTGPSPAKSPASTSTTASAPIRRRSQPAPPVSNSSPRVDKPQTRVKSVKSNQNDSKKIGSTEKKQQSVTKLKKTAKSSVQTPTEDLASSAKPSLYSKVTKKSSVVPLESKPFLRKGSGATSGVNPAVKKKTSDPQEQLTNSEDVTLADGNATVLNSSDLVTEHEKKEIGELRVDTGTESGTTQRGPQKCEDNEGTNEGSPSNPTTVDGIDRLVEPEFKGDAEEEESTISPTAWVEIEEHEDQSLLTGDLDCETVGSQAHIAPVRVSSPRVRHSLSQMLLQETSEPDVVDWGNAENPPTMVFHKDAPKGLKRLLKFARKSKPEANSSGLSSPSVFSEGEDDAEDPKYVNKRSTENLLRKATLHSMNNWDQKNSTDYEHAGQANISKLNAQSLSQQLQDGHVSASVTTTKATRSFFSLSAFKGSK